MERILSSITDVAGVAGARMIFHEVQKDRQFEEKEELVADCATAAEYSRFWIWSSSTTIRLALFLPLQL